MRLAPSEEQSAFAETLHGMLAAADLPKVAAAWADGDSGPGRALWMALAGAGVTGLLVPECWGGQGGGPADLVIACEELGHHAVPGPVAESLATVPALLSAAARTGPGTPATRAESTARTGHETPATRAESTTRTGHETPATQAEGAARTGHEAPATRAEGAARTGHEAPATRAESTTRTGHETPATRAGNAARIGHESPATRAEPAEGAARERLSALAQGRLIASVVAPPWSLLAVDGDSADLVIVVDGDTIREGTAGSVWPSLHPARRLSEADPGAVIASGQDPGWALELGVLACSAQLLGAARALLEMSVEHARQRVQFGRAIGSFQAVQHRLADVAVAIEFARPLLYAAAAAMERDAATPTIERDAATPAMERNAATPAMERDAAAARERDAAAATDKPDTAAAARGRGVGAAGRERGAAGTAAVDVSAAKVACGAAGRLAARVALQTHGAVGYTREHGLWRWLGLVRVLDLGWGTPSWHRGRILGALASGAASDHAVQPGGRRTAWSGQTAARSRRNGPDSGEDGHARTGKEGF